MSGEIDPGFEMEIESVGGSKMSGVEREARVRRIVYTKFGKKYEYGYIGVLLPPEFIGRRVRVIVIDAESLKVVEKR